MILTSLLEPWKGVRYKPYKESYKGIGSLFFKGRMVLQALNATFETPSSHTIF